MQQIRPWRLQGGWPGLRGNNLISPATSAGLEGSRARRLRLHCTVVSACRPLSDRAGRGGAAWLAHTCGYGLEQRTIVVQMCTIPADLKAKPKSRRAGAGLGPCGPPAGQTRPRAAQGPSSPCATPDPRLSMPRPLPSVLGWKWRLLLSCTGNINCFGDATGKNAALSAPRCGLVFVSRGSCCVRVHVSV